VDQYARKSVQRDASTRRRLLGIKEIERMPHRAAKATTSAAKKGKVFSDIEIEAMQAKAAEEKAARKKGGKADGEKDLLAAIAKMAQPDRGLAERIHTLVKAAAPGLASKTWYGMPAYCNAEGKVVCFFQSGQKFKTRYATLGFQEAAKLDDGNFWPNAYALLKLTPADEKRITALLKQAVG
jgi:uncharacterized protein YdhG (YjbR/CyaY superfamily)